MNELDLAVIHDAKNNLGGLALRLEKLGNFSSEIEMLMHTSNRLTNLLLWHKHQEQGMRINIEANSPSDLISEISNEYCPLFPHIKIESNTEKAPMIWFYDELYIRLALENAMHNACQFAKNKVQISVEESNGFLVFKLCDDGPGFSKSIIENHSANKFSDLSRRGTGLGLVLSSSIASMHINKEKNGNVSLHNSHGAVFEMFIP